MYYFFDKWNTNLNVITKSMNLKNMDMSLLNLYLSWYLSRQSGPKFPTENPTEYPVLTGLYHMLGRFNFPLQNIYPFVETKSLELII